jgi:hypothetical protein
MSDTTTATTILSGDTWADDEKEFFTDWTTDRPAAAPAAPPAAPDKLPGQQDNAGKPLPAGGDKPRIKTPADITARSAVMLIDGAQVMGLGAWLNSKLKNRFTDEERALCERLNEQIAAKEIKRRDLPDEQYDMLTVYNQIRDAAAALPLTDQEKKMISEPLEQLVKQNGYDLPPGMALAIGLAQVIGYRAFQVYQV